MCAMTYLNLLFAIAVVMALARVCHLGHGVAGGRLDGTVEPAELPQDDELSRAA